MTRSIEEYFRRGRRVGRTKGYIGAKVGTKSTGVTATWHPCGQAPMGYPDGKYVRGAANPPRNTGLSEPIAIGNRNRFQRPNQESQGYVQDAILNTS